jgi:hypothetical protein
MTEWYAPRTICSTGTPCRRCARISVFAKTVQKLESLTTSAVEWASPSMSESSSPRRTAISSMKAPVPAAHFRFILKSSRFPESSMRMTLLSCPPMSTTVIDPGTRWWQPTAWQWISVRVASANSTFRRP